MDDMGGASLKDRGTSQGPEVVPPEITADLTVQIDALDGEGDH